MFCQMTMIRGNGAFADYPLAIPVLGRLNSERTGSSRPKTMQHLGYILVLGWLLSPLLSLTHAQNPPSPPRPEAPAPQPNPSAAPAAQRDPPFEFLEGDRVVLLGDTLIEREQTHGYIETRLVSRYPGRNIVFRNLGWSADTVTGQSRVSFDWSKPEEEWFKQLKNQIATIKPTVAILGYGMAGSFDGEAGIPKFKADLNKLLDAIQGTSPDKPVRFVLLSPIRHEQLGPPLPDPAKHNQQLALYSKAIKEVSDQRHARFISLFDLVPTRTGSGPGFPLTDNGIHLNASGYWRLAQAIELGLRLGPTTWRMGITADGKVRTGSQFITVEDLRRRDDYVRFTGVTDFLEFPTAPTNDEQSPQRTPAGLLQFLRMKEGVYL